MFEELVTEFGLRVDEGEIRYASYEDTYVMSYMFNTMYIRKNNLMKKFVGTKDEARKLIGVVVKELKAEKEKIRIYKLGQDFE